MKLAFTTLGCPSWDLHTIVSNAREMGFQAIDFRGYLGEMEIYRLPEFGAEKETTAKRIADSGLELNCFSSGVGLMPTKWKNAEASMAELKAYAELCPVFNTTQIRVFGQSIGERNWEKAIEEAAETLTAMARIANDHGARVLLETHDAWVKSDHIRALMEQTDASNVGVLWDIHHPWRCENESAEETWAALNKWIENTHWKDAKLPDHALCLMGDGDLPLSDFYKVIHGGGYDGYYTLEWEKKHHPEMDDPEIAFPRYVEAMRKLESGG